MYKLFAFFKKSQTNKLQNQRGRVFPNLQPEVYSPKFVSERQKGH